MIVRTNRIRAWPVVLLALVPISSSAAELRALPAESFVEATGVNTHLWNIETVYARRYDLMKRRLAELGVRHVRDSGAGNYSGYLGRIRELGDQGIRFNLIVDSRPPTSGIDRAMKFVAGAGEAVTSVEGPNEYDNSGNPAWAAALRRFQTDLHSRAAKLGERKLVVIAPSLTSRDAFDALGDIASAADRGNLHHYFAGRNPGTEGWGDDGYGSIAWSLKNAARQAPGLPVVVTEVGYPNALDSQSENTPVSERIAGRYIPRLILDFLNSGVERVYLYELIDSDGDSKSDLEASFGLLRNDDQLTPKPAFRAVQSLIKLLADGRPLPDAKRAGMPGLEASRQRDAVLNVTLGGNTQDVRQMLFRKSNGTYYLALWIEVPAWDPDTRQEMPVPRRRIEFATPGSSFSNVTIHELQDDGSMSSKPAMAGSIEVTDRLTIVELRP